MIPPSSESNISHGSTTPKIDEAKREETSLFADVDNSATHIFAAVRANGMRLDHLVAIGTSDRLNGFFEIVRTTRASTGVALLSLRNCHFNYLN